MKLPFKGLSNLQKFFITLSAVIILAILDYNSFLNKSGKVEIYDDLNGRISSVRGSITKLEYLLDMFVVARRFEGDTIEMIKTDVNALDENLNEIMENPRYRNLWKKDRLLSEGMNAMQDDWHTIKSEVKRLNDALSQDEIMLIHNAVDMNTLLVNEKAERVLAGIARSRHEVFEETKALALRSIIGFVLLILAGSLIFHKKVLAPFTKAIFIAKRIRAGDTTARFMENGGSPMGRFCAELNRAFDSMEKARWREEAALSLSSDRLKKKSDEIAALNSVAAFAGRSLAQSEVFAYSLNEALRTSGADAGAVYLVEGGEFRLKGAAGFGDLFTKDGQAVPLGAFAGFEQKKQGWIMAEAEFPDNDFSRLLKLFGTALVSVTPMVYDNEVRGLLLITYRDASRFDDDSVQFFEAVASCVSVASGHSGLFQKELASRKFLDRLIQQMPYGLAVFDKNGACLLMNSPLKKILGADQKYQGGGYVIFEDDIFVSQGLTTALRKSYEGYTTEFIINYSPLSVRKQSFTGAPRKLRIKCFPLYDAGGDISNIALLYEDLTGAESAEAGESVQ